MSALLFARGLVGPTGRIVMVDSESGRGSLFADIIPGGYSVIDIEPPFSPERYEQAIVTAEANADCVVVDSLSHEHNGEGGVLDMQEAELDRMAGDNWGKREACKMASWIKPKMAHKKFIQRLLRLKCGLICCLRGEEKTKMVKQPDGKNKVITDDFSSPLFDPRFLFELLLNFETIAKDGKGGFVIPRKVTHPDIATLLPADGQQIGIAHGEALARWCAAPGGKPVAQPTAQAPVATPDEIKALTSKLWSLCKPFRGTVQSWDAAVNQLRAWKILSPEQRVSTLTVEQLREVIDKTEVALQEMEPATT